MHYSAYVKTYLSKLATLGDPLRFRVVRLLDQAAAELCIAEITDILRVPQYAASRASGTLRRAGVLQERRDGKLVYYRVAADPFVARLVAAVRAVPRDDDEYGVDVDRLRWRLEIRDGGSCVVTYPDVDSRPPKEGRPGILFICVHNSARSQMAEAYLRRFGGDVFDVESAGLTPGELNPHVVDALAEDGIDISGKRTRSVVDLYRAGHTYSYVITVCSRAVEKNCPVFPGPVNRINWPFPDPSRFTGTDAEIAYKVRGLRDAIREKVKQFVAAHRERAMRGASR